MMGQASIDACPIFYVQTSFRGLYLLSCSERASFRKRPCANHQAKTDRHPLVVRTARVESGSGRPLRASSSTLEEGDTTACRQRPQAPGGFCRCAMRHVRQSAGGGGGVSATAESRVPARSGCALCVGTYLLGSVHLGGTGNSGDRAQFLPGA